MNKCLQTIIGGISLLLLFFPHPLYCQTEQQPVEQFVNSLLYSNQDISSFVNQEELRLSQRFGITYDGIQNRFLISYDFDNDIKHQIQSRAVEPLVTKERVSDSVVKLTISIPEAKQQKAFYFREDKLISPVAYYTTHWKRIESKYFSFLISDSTLFHTEAIQALENLVEQMATALELTSSELQILQKEKIVYVFCKDENEIEAITGYKSRGMYLLPYDYIVTTYNCHYHELLHLLMNFKLKHLPLYTHPFLQEGFAVAFGGRGGIATSTLMQIGVFLTESKFLVYNELLNSTNFRLQDASLSYSLSGLYTQFLFQSIGLNNYLALYKNHSSTKSIDSLVISEDNLPPETTWQHFVDSMSNSSVISLHQPDSTTKTKVSNENVIVNESEYYYHIQMKHSFALRPKTPDTTYTSKRFRELFPKSIYQGEHFLFMADSNEVTIYDLYTNNSIGGYASAFTLKQQKVQYKNGWYEYCVKKNIFHVPIHEMEIADENE